MTVIRSTDVVRGGVACLHSNGVVVPRAIDDLLGSLLYVCRFEWIPGLPDNLAIALLAPG